VAVCSVITACQRAGEWRKALNILLKMLSEGPEPDVQAYNAVLSACANAGEWQMALKVSRSHGTRVRFERFGPF
jgi:pentatricopeptide repeat domain-containing protein 1